MVSRQEEDIHHQRESMDSDSCQYFVCTSTYTERGERNVRTRLSEQHVVDVEWNLCARTFAKPRCLTECVCVCVCSRVVMAIAGGCASGVMHLTGMQGIIFYVLLSAVVSACIWIKAARSIGTEHATLAAGGVWGAMEGAAQGALSYVLFWTYVCMSIDDNLCVCVCIYICAALMH